MEIKIRFEDVNHELIAIHRIEYNTITPPYFAVMKYCEEICKKYPNVMYFFIECNVFLY